jgi:hypothetical protein
LFFFSITILYKTTRIVENVYYPSAKHVESTLSIRRYAPFHGSISFFCKQQDKNTKVRIYTKAIAALLYHTFTKNNRVSTHIILTMSGEIHRIEEDLTGGMGGGMGFSGGMGGGIGNEIRQIAGDLTGGMGGGMGFPGGMGCGMGFPGEMGGGMNYGGGYGGI